MKPLFTAEVFDKIWLDRYDEFTPKISKTILSKAEKERIAFVAQCVFEKFLKRGKKMYGAHGYNWSGEKFSRDTHEARLVCVKKIYKGKSGSIPRR